MPIAPEHKEILSTQSESKTLPEWVEFFDFQYTKKQIYGFIYHNKLPYKRIPPELNQNGRKWHINQDYFKTWSSNMAYLLGFWYADGCIYGGKMFDITVHAKDKYIIKKFAEELSYDGPIKDYVDRQAARINFCCKVIYNDLISLGGTERKSLTLTFPTDIVPEEYLSDFIRGYFDGDGCVCLVKGGRINTSFCSGSKKFLDELLLILKEKAGIQGGSYDPSSKTIRFGKKDSLKLYLFMYKNNPELFLLRKKEKFKKFFNI